MLALKLISIGDAVGIVLPRKVLARLKLAKDDVVYLTDAPDGYRLTAGDPALVEQMLAARRIMKKRRAALRELSK